MAKCSSLISLFEKPLPPENPSLIESLSSWKQIKPMKPLEVSPFAEIFGELYFHEKPKEPTANSSLPTTSPAESPSLDKSLQINPTDSDSKNSQNGDNRPLDSLLGVQKNKYACDPKSNGGLSRKKSESLLLCTEGLGSESADDVDDLMESGNDWRNNEKKVTIRGRSTADDGVREYSKGCLDVRSSRSGKGFPPPISSIGKSGKPWMRLRSYRENGRFVLKEIRIPSQEFLHASRGDGRLTLHFVHQDEDIAEGEEGEEGEKDDNEVVVEEEESEKLE